MLPIGNVGDRDAEFHHVGLNYRYRALQRVKNSAAGTDDPA